MTFKKYLYVIIYFLVSMAPRNIVFGQNLVFNPSFEILNSCPSSLLDMATSPYAEGWMNPNTGTPDLFTNCNTAHSTFWVPFNAFGFRNPKTGDQYAGMFAIQSPFQGREYLQTKLIYPLIKDSKYCFSFYFSLADVYSTVSMKRLGSYLSVEKLEAGEDSVNFSYVMPQLVYSGDTVNQLTDWLKFEEEYVAQGGEQYLTIGNFFSDSLSDTMAVNHATWVTGKICYFYIDDVSLFCCDPAGCGYTIPNSFTPNGDGFNDTWDIFGVLPGTIVQVYNRWGNLVFKSDNYSGNWSGDNLPDGTYYYVVNGGDGLVYSGFLELVR